MERASMVGAVPCLVPPMSHDMRTSVWHPESLWRPDAWRRNLSSLDTTAVRLLGQAYLQMKEQAEHVKALEEALDRRQAQLTTAVERAVAAVKRGQAAAEAATVELEGVKAELVILKRAQSHTAANPGSGHAETAAAKAAVASTTAELDSVARGSAATSVAQLELASAAQELAQLLHRQLPRSDVAQKVGELPLAEAALARSQAELENMRRYNAELQAELESCKLEQEEAELQQEEAEQKSQSASGEEQNEEEEEDEAVSRADLDRSFAVSPTSSPVREVAQGDELRGSPKPPVVHFDKPKTRSSPSGQKMVEHRMAQLRSKMKAASYSLGGQEWSKLFSFYDRDGSSDLDWDEFRRAVRKDVQITAAMVSDSDLRDLFNYVDVDGDGTIGQEEFIRLLAGEHNHWRANASVAAETGDGRGEGVKQPSVSKGGGRKSGRSRFRVAAQAIKIVAPNRGRLRVKSLKIPAAGSSQAGRTMSSSR